MKSIELQTYELLTDVQDFFNHGHTVSPDQLSSYSDLSLADCVNSLLADIRCERARRIACKD